MPDLAVEVVSPTNTYGEVVDKVAEYLRAGVRSVWVVYPLGQTVSVHDGSRRVMIFRGVDELDGDEILPGFRLRLNDLFDETAGTGPMV